MVESHHRQPVVNSWPTPTVGKLKFGKKQDGFPPNVWVALPAVWEGSPERPTLYQVLTTRMRLGSRMRLTLRGLSALPRWEGFPPHTVDHQPLFECQFASRKLTLRPFLVQI
jgi:hypothetical protein